MNETARFSTPEAAHILDLPVETFRTQLKAGYLPEFTEREPGTWRSFNAGDLVYYQVALGLANCNVPMATAARFVSAARLNLLSNGVDVFERETVYFYLKLDSHGSVVDWGECDVSDLGVSLLQGPKAAVCVVLDLMEIRCSILNRISNLAS